VAELLIDRDLKLELRARAHHLKPGVLLGAAGLSDAVLKEIERALVAHELVKIRVPADDRAEREAVLERVVDQLGAARIQTIGKALVVWRPRPPEADDEPPRVAGSRRAGPAKAGTRAAKTRPATKRPDPAPRGRRR